MLLVLTSIISLAAAMSNVVSVPSVPLSQGAACACFQLSAQFAPNAVLFKNSSAYHVEAVNYYDLRADLLPACIVLPSDADQVATAVSTMSSCGAQFAIRAVGHCNVPGSNNINGGVLLALNNLKHLQVTNSNATLEIGPGNTWFDVYSFLDPYNLYVVGGRLKTIGVSGLTLFGGYHYFINKYGFAMDNVVSYDVVLGNGTQLIANASSNSELFWALKGGANNFGVVTKFVFKTLEAPLISTTIQQFAESEIEDFIKASVDLSYNDNNTLGAGQVLTIQYDVTTKVASAGIIGVQEGSESPPSHFANFSSIPSISTINNVTKPAIFHSQLDTPGQMFRGQFAMHTMIHPDAAQLIKIYRAWKDAIDAISDVEGLLPTFVLNVTPQGAARVGQTNGIGNVWGLDASIPTIIWQFANNWINPADDIRMSLWASQLADYWQSQNEEIGLASDFLYMGDTSETQDPFQGFPRENVDRMVRIRRDYDPLRVFTALNWGGFKLPALA
ncbi:hypothetical protein GGR57DRAFT_477713 [Xylariaceae sp. FL1272]|nr:hypothetical protein GGR57DRAFT_477713 [Xylariaceae sp. FL1272]